MTFKKSLLVLSTLALSSMAQAQDFVSMTTAQLRLPQDGSNCDARVIATNLRAVKKVLNATDLAPTMVTVSGSCYAVPCQAELNVAVAKHCEKAEKLAEIAALLR